MTFEKINDRKYNGKLDGADEEAIQKALSIISCNLESDYEIVTNQVFLDSLVARYVSACFFKEYNIQDNFFTLVDVSAFNRPTTVSVGCLMVDENVFKRTSGVLYN
jgi:hypothetical protein